ncbi:MAG: glycine zipper 2TM domain-containing protein [Thermodesulfovibrionales bacterium]
MSTLRKAVSAVLVLALLSIGACATYQYEGAATGGAVGGVAGALLDRSNPWRGGVIGAALGAIFGATISEVSVRGARQAAYTGRPVEYRTEDGRGVYRAEPLEYNARTDCHKVHERVWEDGRLVKDQIREVCEAQKTEPKY